QLMSDLGGVGGGQQPAAPAAPKQGLWASVLRGALQGLATGGVVGAGEGAVFHNDLDAQRNAASQLRQQKVAEGAANVSWAQARATQAIAVAANAHNVIDQQNQDWKDEHADRSIARMQTFQNAGLSPTNIVDDTPEAAANAASQMLGNHQIPFV